MAKTLFGVVLSMLVCCLPLWGQTQVPDSQKSELPQDIYNAQRVDLLCDTARLLWATSPDSSLLYSQEALALADSLGYASGQARALNYMGVAQRRLSRLEEAHNQHTLALSLATVHADSLGMAQSLNYAGVVYIQQGLVDRAVKNYYDALLIVEKIHAPEEKSIVLNNLATAYLRLNDNAKALEILEMSLALKTELQDERGLGVAYNNLGVVYENLGQYGKAKDYFAASMAIKVKRGDKRGILSTLKNQAQLLLKENRPTHAVAVLDKALALSNDIGDRYIKADCLRLMAEASLMQGNSLEAVAKANESLALAQSIGALEKVRDAAGFLKDYYQASADHQAANTAMLLYYNTRDSLDREANFREILQLDLDYAHDKERIAKEKAAIKQEAEKRLQQFFRNILISGFLLSCAFSYSIYRGRKKLKQANLELLAKNREISRQKDEMETLAEELQAINEDVSNQRMELESLNQVKDRMFSIVSHDLRGPINSLSGILKLIRSEAITPDEIRSLIPKLSDNISRASDMLNTLLVWARGQMQGGHTTPENTDLALLAHEVLEHHQPVAENKGISLHNRLPASFLAFTDKEMARIILRNLVSNALKFTSEGSVTLSGQAENGMVALTVADTGTGMTEKNLENLFTGSFNSTPGTANEQGTGIGLVLSQEFAHANKGRITAESQPGKGTAFTLLLPAGQKDQEAGKTPENQV